MPTCPYCAESVPPRTVFCPYCATDLTQRRQSPQAFTDMGESSGMRMLLPVGRSGWAIAAGYLGLFSLLAIPAPFAIICAILAFRDINRNPKRHGMGRAVFGLVMGVLGTILLIFGIVAFLMRA